MEVLTMNDTSHDRGISNTGWSLMGFALGAAVGAGLALLLAPDSGKKTRQRLANTARRWRKSAVHTIDQARNTMVELRTDAKSAITAGREAFLHDPESRVEHRKSHAADTAAGLNKLNRSGERASR
jgi:gas vesicle protein